MKDLTCTEVRHRLDAYHDGELAVDDQIALDAHFEWCDGCARARSDLRVLRAAVRALAPGRLAFAADLGVNIERTVMSRIKAEREASVVARVRLMFEDMHLVYAGLGAAVATVVCLMVVLSMMRFATIARPDSLAAIVDLMASPGSNGNPVALDSRMMTLPRFLDGSFSHDARGAEEDTVFALAAVVTREGRIANLELLQSGEDAKLAESLMDAVSRARFEPASLAGEPVAVNMIWLVAHTTVRGSKHPLDLPAAPTTGRKRAAQLTTASTAIA